MILEREVCHIARKISKDVVALFGESDFVDSVADEAGLKQVAGVLACFTAICKALHMMKQPVDHIRAYESIGYSDLQPHPVSNLQT